MANIRRTRTTVHICNILISLLCVLSIAAYFFMPLWKVELTFHVDAEMLEDILPETEASEETTGDEPTSDENSSESSGDESGEEGNAGDAASGDESGEEENAGNVLEDSFDFTAEDIVGTEGIDLSLGLTLETKDILPALTSDATDAVRKALTGLIDNSVNQLVEPMHQMAKTVVKAASRKALKDAVRDRVKSVTGGKYDTEEKVNDLLDAAGVTDIYIDDEVDKIVEKMYEDGATVTSVSNDVIASVETALGKLHEQDSAIATTLSDENKAKIRQNVKEALSIASKEDGTIDMNSVVADMLVEMIGGSSSDDTAKAESADVALCAATTETGENDIEDVKATLRDLLMEKMSDKVLRTISLVLKIVGYVLLFTFFTWAYLIVKILAKIGKKNNAIKLKMPIWLGIFPALLLWLIPNFALSALMETMGSEEMAAFTFKFTSGSCVSLFVAAFFVLFSLFFYGRLRRRLKKYAKGKLQEDEDDGLTKEERAAQKHAAYLAADKNYIRNEELGNDVEEICAGDEESLT